MFKINKNLNFKKQINISKRGYNLIYLERCKVIVSNETVVYIQKKEREELYYNIPYLNTSILMLGTGTSITNEAIRLLSNNSIIIMFIKNKYKVFSNTTEEFTILTPTSEYKPTEYMQKFAYIFFNPKLRLKKSKELFDIRIETTKYLLKFLIDKKYINSIKIYNTYEQKIVPKLKNEINNIANINELLLVEARYRKELLQLFYQYYNLTDNELKFKIYKEYQLNLNYFAYGMAASTLTTLGISFAFPLLHGKTRRGALVFDIADIIKDGFSIPLSFYYYYNDFSEKETRKETLKIIKKSNIFSLIFDSVKKIVEDINLKEEIEC